VSLPTIRSFVVLVTTLVACQGKSTSSAGGSSASAAQSTAIQVVDGKGVVTSRIVPGHPCRAEVDGVEMQVGGRPLVAQLGSRRWTGEDAANGTTFKLNDAPVARIHAKQLFDGEGVPLVRVSDNGDIANGGGRILRKAIVAGDKITIGEFVVTGTTDLVLAAMLTAKTEATPELRALAACHFLLPTEDRTP
jgi:hypothetical protein